MMAVKSPRVCTSRLFDPVFPRTEGGVLGGCWWSAAALSLHGCKGILTMEAHFCDCDEKNKRQRSCEALHF